MSDYISEGVEVAIATEAVRGVSPSSGWLKAQVDVGGLSGFERTYTDVERDIHSVNATQEKGDHVAYEVTPSLTHDLNKDFVDATAHAVYRCNAKHFGSTGLSLFRPTAVVDGGVSNDSYTVAALGALPDNLLIKGAGFTNAANNGLYLTAGTSTGTSIKTATGVLVAEASAPANATLDVVGFQGAAGVLAIDADKNLTSSGVDFTTLGLVRGMEVHFPPQAKALEMGSANYGFATAYGRAMIDVITATKLTLKYHTAGIVADTGVGKTVRVFVTSRLYRNYAIDDTTNYAEKTLAAEKTDIKPGVSADTRHTTVNGCGANTLTISAPIDSKITATLGLVGMTATTPVAAASRVAGPSTAYAPLNTALNDTQNDLREIRLLDPNGVLVADVLSWTATINNNVKARKSQGVFGASGLNFGKFMYAVNMEAYYQDSDAVDAADENRDSLVWDAFIANHQYGVVLRMPNVALRMPTLTYASNEPVMMNCDIVGFREPSTGIACTMGVFGYIP